MDSKPLAQSVLYFCVGCTQQVVRRQIGGNTTMTVLDSHLSFQELFPFLGLVCLIMFEPDFPDTIKVRDRVRAWVRAWVRVNPRRTHVLLQPQFTSING